MKETWLSPFLSELVMYVCTFWKLMNYKMKSHCCLINLAFILIWKIKKVFQCMSKESPFILELILTTQCVCVHISRLKRLADLSYVTCWSMSVVSKIPCPCICCNVALDHDGWGEMLWRASTTSVLDQHCLPEVLINRLSSERRMRVVLSPCFSCCVEITNGRTRISKVYGCTGVLLNFSCINWFKT